MNSKELARQKIVKSVFLIYWMLIFEGAFRKWVFPEYQQIILFLRDPVVLFVYVTAIRHRILTKNSFLTAGVIISLIFIPLIFFQLVFVKMNALTLAYGWRMYSYYIPLAFVIKDAFNKDDIFKLFRQTLYIGIPISMLVYFQFISPRNSFINNSYSTADAFVVTGNIVRTTGTFTFVIGQFMFTGSIITMCLYCWIYRARDSIISLPALLCCTPSALAVLLLSGSRTAFFMTGLILVATYFGLLISKDNRLRIKGSFLVLFFVVIGIVMFLGPFRDSFDAILSRFDEARAAEGSPIMRALAPLIAFLSKLLSTPVFGFGMGYGTGGGSMLATGKAQLVLAEDEWSRVIQEIGPGFGIVYILYRVFFTLYLAKSAINSARNQNNILPMMLLGFIGFYIFVGQITHQASMHGYTWIFVGLIMAAAKSHQTETVAPISKPLYPNIVGVVPRLKTVNRA